MLDLIINQCLGILMLLPFAVWYVVFQYRKSKALEKEITLRKNPKHKLLVGLKWFRVYYSGAYAWLEIDFGRIGRHEFVILLGCTDKLIRFHHNKPQLEKVKSKNETQTLHQHDMSFMNYFIFGSVIVFLLLLMSQCLFQILERG